MNKQFDNPLFLNEKQILCYLLNWKLLSMNVYVITGAGQYEAMPPFMTMHRMKLFSFPTVHGWVNHCGSEQGECGESVAQY